MNWEELSAYEFADAVGTCGGVCLWPIGCLEKHGNHLPLGTDIAVAREVARRAAAAEPFLIFPYYPFGFVSEVRHKVGTVSLAAEVQCRVLEQTCDEIARNGCRKIILGSGHGGNSHSLRAFALSLLDRRRDYLVYVLELWRLTPEQTQELTATHGRPPESHHADLVETSQMMAINPPLVHLDRIVPGEGVARRRLKELERRGVYTALNWYGDYPEQIAGDPAGASATYGQDVLDFHVRNLVDAVRAIKQSDAPLDLLREFYDAADAVAPPPREAVNDGN
jgi:creatinine amidohydrolase